MRLDETHDPQLRSWVESANEAGHDFPIQNLPYGVFRTRDDPRPRIGVAIGDEILELEQFSGDAALGLNRLMAMPESDRRQLRRDLSRTLAAGAARRRLVIQSDAEMLLPAAIGDYTDFYASIHHATNVGAMLRPDSPLLPNYKHIPIAYHGRSSSIVVSGASIRRPSGQIADQPAGPPRFAPCAFLDYEVELGAFLGPGNRLGEPILIDQAEEHLFGVCLVNDWSARDIQRWEYQPLGPFLSKNFATSISPWVVALEALEPFRRPAAPRAEGDPAPLPYLQSHADAAFDITLEAWIQTMTMSAPQRVSQSSFAGMYWTLPQMITHHASNGCPIRPGDLIASGTVSGPQRENRGCLLEMTERGLAPLQLSSGETRIFLADGDTVIFRGWCEAPGFSRIGLGEVRGQVLAAGNGRGVAK